MTTFPLIRVDAVAREQRDSVDPASLNGDVEHWSIPNLDATGGPQTEPASTIASAKIRLSGGEVLVSRLNPRKARIVCVPGQLMGEHLCSGEFIVLRPKAVDQRYLWYVLSSEETRQLLDASVQSVTRSHQRVRPELVTHLRLPIPPPAEQRRIADFLDAETSRIDALIAAKQRMIELLTIRLEVASETGLAPMGGEPMIRLGSLVREVDHRLGAVEDAPTLLSVSIHRGVVPFHEMVDRPPRAEDFNRYKVCEAGDIVINRLRAFQGGVGVAPERGIVSPDYLVLRPTRPADGPYLHHLMRSPWFVGRMTEVLRGIGEPGQGNVRTPRVNWKDLRLILVPERDKDERDARARTVGRVTTSTQRLIAALSRQVALLRERRQALITAAVTGELSLA